MTTRTKNIVMIVAAVILAASMVFTVSYAGTHSASMPSMPSHGMQMGPGGQNNDQQGQPPQMPGDNSQSGDQSNQSGDQNNSQSGDQKNSQSGNQSNNQQGQPPQMPGDNSQSGDQSNQSGDQNNSQSGNQNNSQQGQPPQMPGDNSQSGDQSNGQSGNQSNGPSGGPSDHQGQPPQMKGGIASIDGKYYALFGAESLAFALIILYLIFSNLNQKSFQKTFRTRSRIAAFVLAAILAGGCMTQAEAGISRYIATNSDKGPQQQMQLTNTGTNGGGQASTEAEATGATTVDGTEETLNDSYTSSNADENAVLVTGGGTLTSDGATIDKKSGDSSNTGSSDFSGVNAALLVNDNSTATVKNATIKSSAKGANGVFATGEKSTVKISDSTIITTGEASSRGLDATYGGTITASNVKIKTQGGSCAAMATDRGEGTVSATKSTLETNGAGSPVIYSTGNITLKDSTGAANGAQITVVEGKNSATIENSKVTCSAAGNRGDVDVAGVMVYQSMSGDASEGTGNFTATDSTLTINKDSKYYKTAPMFFVTNTDAVIKLTDTALNYGSNILLSSKGTSEWGNEGSNGGTVTLDAAEQTLKGDIQLDKISTLTMNMSKGSTYTGTINGDNTAKSITLKLDKSSKIKLTGDSYVSSLEDADTSYSNIDFNGHKLYVDGKAIN